MAHPSMYRDDDRYLSELRRICLGLPEAVEIETWGQPTFRAGSRMFAVFHGSQNDFYSVMFKPEPEERAALVADERFYLPPYLGPSGWLGLYLDAAPVDWVEIAELMECSYRLVALKRMIKALDARPAPGAGRSG